MSANNNEPTKTANDKKKMRIKKGLFAGGMVFLLGVLLFVAGMSALDWDFYKLDTTTYTAKNFTPAPEQTVTRVELDVDSFPVTVTVGDALALSYFEAGDSNVSVTCEDGVLKVKEDYTYRFMKNSWFNFGRLKRKYELTLPQGVEIVLVGSSGDVTLNGLQLGDLAVNSANLDLILRDCTFQSLTVESANADIELYNCTGGKVSAEGVNLDFEAQGCAFASLYVKGTNADVELVDVTAPAMEIRGTNADFALENIRTDALTVHGTNLDAHIIINGAKADYTIVTSGRDLPDEQTGATDKRIALSGTDNDVTLRFAA